MKRVRVALLMLVLTGTVYPDVVSAQGRGSVEFGVDARLGKILYSDQFQGTEEPVDDPFVAQFPLVAFRVGPYLSDRIQIEPSLGFYFVNADTDLDPLISSGGYTDLNLGLDLLLYFADPGGTAPFLRIGPGLRWISFDTSATDANETATQFSLGGGFGVRVPAGDRLAMRLQASAERNFESNEFRASWDAGVMFGLSFFTVTSPGDPRAQGSGSVEIGLDARVSKTLTSDEFQGVNDPRDDPFIAQFPFAMFRVGPYLTDRIQLEPSVGFYQISVEGEGYHDLNLGLDLLLYLADPGESAPFIRIGPGLHWVNIGTADFIPGFDDTATQVSLGGGFGVRVPAGDRLAMRLQAIGERNFESDEFRASWDVGAMFGLSFFTK